MRRRTFIARSGNLALVSLLAGGLPSAAHSDPLGIPVGLQLWTVNDDLKADPAGTLKKLRRIGYTNVETAGFGKLSAAAFRRLIDDAGLNCPSAHLDFRNSRPEPLFDDAHALGAHFVVSAVLRAGTGPLPTVGPWLKDFAGSLRTMTLEDAKRTAELANQIGMKAKQAGLQYAYHNHFFEFVDQDGGAVAYDVLLRETDPELVKFQIDCGWMMIAGYDPADYLRRYPQRIPMLHVKDYRAVPDKGGETALPGMRVGAELGRGFIDYRTIFAAAKKENLQYYFAEQEPPFGRLSPLEAVQVDYDYLHALNARP